MRDEVMRYEEMRRRIFARTKICGRRFAYEDVRYEEMQYEVLSGYQV